MKSRRHLFAIVAISLFCGAISGIQAQDTKIAVVDMQQIYNEYKQTKVETDKLKALEDEKRKELDGFAAEIKKIEEQIEKDGKKVQEMQEKGVNEETLKKEFETLLKPQYEARAAKLKELGDKNKVATELMVSAANEMQVRLGEALTGAVEALAKSKGIDLVLDKGSLGRTVRKSIVFSSDKVLDLTNEVIAVLNK